MSTEEFTELERAAFAADAARFGKQRWSEPLRSKGGPLDPAAWSMALAVAVRDGTPLPRMFKDMETPPDHPSVVAAEAVFAESDPACPATHDSEEDSR